MSFTERFLTIQSHVISGYCGNKCSTFPLQLLGFEVDVINSVQLSNHTQYRVTKGQIFKSQDLEELHQGLKENNLLRLYDNILSGYVSDVGYIKTMSKVISDIKQLRPDVIYSLDPVLGDIDCGFYVKDGKNIADVYMTHLVPLADIITPNVFEASVLTGLEFNRSSDKAMVQATAMIEYFHDLGIPTVALTSFEIDDCKDQLICLLSHKNIDASKSGLWKVAIPKIPAEFYGTGDLFSSLLSAWLRKTQMDMKLALKNTVNIIQDILQDTYQFSQSFNDGTPLGKELRLVQNQSCILQPSSKIEVRLMVL